MKIKSFAKINLGLRVLNRRADGFHNIETIFASVDLSDTLTLSRCDELIVTTNHPDCPSGRDNLVYKAAYLLQRACNVRTGVRIRIRKRIPMGGGLGGGSGNAAAAVKALQRFWGINPSRPASLPGFYAN